MPEIKPVRFGIVGCGSASIPVCHALAGSALAELAVVYDVNDQLADDISQRFHARKAATFDEFLADPAIEAAYIAVPHHLLAPLTQQVLEAGKHALTEKPLALSLEEVDRLIRISEERDLRLGVFYEMRYAPAYAAARQLAQAGAIGKIIGAHVQTLIDKPISYWQTGYMSRSINPWRGLKAQAGGGVVLMNTSHLLDALAYVTGLTVTQVSAEVETLAADVDVEDMAVATLRFDNGAIGSLISGAHIIGADRDECCNLYGTKGQIRMPDPYGPDPLRFYLKEAWRDFVANQWHALPAGPLPVHQLAVEDFARAVRSGVPAPICAEAARQVLAVVLSIYRSAVERRTISI
jgi:predicted dehydrogenase